MVHKQHYLYVLLKVPVAYKQAFVNTYHFHALPVPVPPKAGATKITNLPSYLAVTRDHKYFTTMTTIEYNECRGPDETVIAHCPFTKSFQAYNKPTCPVALLMNSPSLIKQTCTFSYMSDIIEPHITPLDADSLLIYNTTVYTQACGNQLQAIQGCSFCVKPIPCDCAIVTPEQYFLPALKHCDKFHTNTSTIYPLNLAIMQYFMNDTQLTSINAITHVTPSQHATIVFNFTTDHDMDHLISKDATLALDLEKLINATVNNATFHAKPTDPLVDPYWSSNSNAFPITKILTVTNAILLIATIMWLAYVSIRVHILASAILMTTQMHPVQALHDMSIPPTCQPADIAKQVASAIPAHTYMPEMFVTISFLICLVMMLVMYYKNQRTKNSVNSHLHIEVTSGQSCFTIPIMTLPYCPCDYHFQALSYPSDLSVQGILRPRLIINWHLLTATHFATAQTARPPTTLKVNPFIAPLLKRLLRNKHYAFLFMTHRGNAFHFKICPFSCIGCGPEFNTRNGISHNDQAISHHFDFDLASLPTPSSQASLPPPPPMWPIKNTTHADYVNLPPLQGDTESHC